MGKAAHPSRIFCDRVEQSSDRWAHKTIAARWMAGILAQPKLSADANHDAAMTELRKFIMNDVARKAYANKSYHSKSANDFVESFPPYAKQEILEIMLLILQEKGGSAIQDVNRMKSGGARNAYGGFSPNVRGRVDALVRKLKSDKNFNSKSNLNRMRKTMPAH